MAMSEIQQLDLPVLRGDGRWFRRVPGGAGEQAAQHGHGVVAVFAGGVDIAADVEPVLGGVFAGQAAGYLLLGFQRADAALTDVVASWRCCTTRRRPVPDSPQPCALRPWTDYNANVLSTNPTLGIDHSSPVPLHEQVAAAIRRAIADGEARPGERLPPARDLAAVLGVNANTVFRALRTLREEGLVEFRRGRGVSVTGNAPQRSPVVAKARELVAVARRYGFRPEELTEIIEQMSWELP